MGWAGERKKNCFDLVIMQILLQTIRTIESTDTHKKSDSM